jgi:hypothetical protein
MGGLENLMAEILRRYNGSLYNYALTKLVYLVDVHHAAKHGRTVTGIDWKRDHYGPFVWEIIDTARRENQVFSVSIVGENKKVVSLRPGQGGQLPREVTEAIDEVVTAAPDPNHGLEAFLKYVYSTPPMKLSRGRGSLNVVEAMEAWQDVDETTEAMFNDPDWDEALRFLAAN